MIRRVETWWESKHEHQIYRTTKTKKIFYFRSIDNNELFIYVIAVSPWEISREFVRCNKVDINILHLLFRVDKTFFSQKKETKTQVLLQRRQKSKCKLEWNVLVFLQGDFERILVKWSMLIQTLCFELPTYLPRIKKHYFISEF